MSRCGAANILISDVTAAKTSSLLGLHASFRGTKCYGNRSFCKGGKTCPEDANITTVSVLIERDDLLTRSGGRPPISMSTKASISTIRLFDRYSRDIQYRIFRHGSVLFRYYGQNSIIHTKSKNLCHRTLDLRAVLHQKY